MLFLSDVPTQIALLNELLVTPGHHHHQRVARELQRHAHPSTVPFAAKALAQGFEHLEYTASEPGVIAKWFSWLLCEIGTPDAIAVLQEYAQADEPEVAAEMRHRLSKMNLTDP